MALRQPAALHCLPGIHVPADGGAPYALVLPYPRHRFTAEDMQQQLLGLGLQPRQLLLLEPLSGPVGGRRSGGSSGWSLGGMLSTAASYFNPYSYLSGAAGTPREQAAAVAADSMQAAGAGQQGAVGDAMLPSSGGGQGRGPRKRALGGGGSNIHTLGEGSSSDAAPAGGQDPESNDYWNGNSTTFGGAPPPPGQQ
jgi:hypothetical protein